MRAGTLDLRAETMAAHGKRGVSEHLSAWRDYLTSRGNSAEHVRKSTGAATRILTAANVGVLADLAPSRILKAVKELNGGNASARTRNVHLGAVRSFVRWCIHDGRLAADPLAGMKSMNVEKDRRRVRRPLLDDELARLIRAAETGPEYHLLSGADRSVLYRLASGSGLRAGEIASLTPASFNLSPEGPSVTVQAAHSKRGKLDVQPIRSDLADVLRPWLANKPKGAPVFTGRMGRTAEMIRFDLRRARRAWALETGDLAEAWQRRSTDFLRRTDGERRIVDFHALRASFITSIVRAGASVKVAQSLARHSDPKLTLNCYTTLGLHDVRAGLDGLPVFDDDAPESEAAALRATGTDGPASGGLTGRNAPANRCEPSPSIAPKASHGRTREQRENPLKTRGNRASSRGNATHCENSPGWIRTSDPRIMSPLL